ncbi:MAG TPA: DUF4038 domain-containing protein [bacterium]|nr:DUF4038 domain-containing protein [bacterium]HOM26337.1 DUF4038 domain-containing protein [bacterium]
MLYTEVNVPVEFSLRSYKRYKDIFNEVEVDVIFTSSKGEKFKVPAFWKGENEFGVRVSFPEDGIYEWESISNNEKERGLHGQKGKIKVEKYKGKNPLFVHGRLKISENKRYLCHKDGKPFFWLGDTWWMGLCKRLKWPEEFKELTDDRIKKGFTLIQIVAGLYPDMSYPDRRGENEAGYPWDKNFKRINPYYFDMADLRLFHLINSGLISCIVGCWGYYLKWMGIEKMKKHWRYLIARYSAYPVIWCASGEYDMPFYLSETSEEDKNLQRNGWKEVIKYIKKIDPYKNPVTVHPGSFTREVEGYSEILDFDVLQTGHSDDSIKNTVYRVKQSYEAEPVMPVVIGEVAYEGIGGQCREQIQRLSFWASFLNGACGFTYGANGIWQVNRKEEIYGPSPHGMNWGNTPWDEAMSLPGSKQLGLSKKLLEKYRWWEFQPRPDWIEVDVSSENREKNYYPYIAGIPEEVRIVYIPFFYNNFKIKKIEKNVKYKTFLFNPVNGEKIDSGVVNPDREGNWELPSLVKNSWAKLPIYQDWILVLERI